MRAMTAGLAKAVQRPKGEGKKAVLSALAARFGNRFSASQALREQHANTLTWLGCEPPDAVVFAESEADVSDVVKLCAASRMPIIPFGTGTSLEGHVNAPFGGVSLDLSRMNRIVAMHEADLDCVVEPGVTRKQLNDHLRDAGLFFPVDPGADASLGGMAATRASGTNAVRYGTMRDLVLGLSAVLADGSVIKTGGRPLIDPADPEERRKVQAFLDSLIERALAFGGTCTGEHGIGEGKISFRAEHGSGVEV